MPDAPKKAAYKPLFLIYKSLHFKNRKREYLFVHCRIKHLEKTESEIGPVCLKKKSKFSRLFFFT